MVNDVNIAIISHLIYPCNSGGLEIFNHYFIKEISSLGHRIWLFTCCNYDWNNESIHRVKLRKGKPGLIKLILYFSLIFNLIKYRDEIDIVHIPYTSNDFLAFPILLINKLLDIPYVVTIHGGGMLKWKLKVLHQSYFRNANAIVAVSETIKKEYEKRSSRKIKMIPPLIPFVETKVPKSELKSKYGFNNNDYIILSLGRIRKNKGSDILLEAFMNLGKEYIESKNLKLVYVGDGNLRTELEKEVEVKDFNQYIKFFGILPHEKVSDIYKIANIYIIPSFFEGTPISLLEAMFNSLPIIGTNVRGINNLISDKKNGLLFEKGNIDDLRSKIRALIEDSNQAKRLGSSAKRDYSKGYLFKNMISDHIKLYEKVLDYT